MVMRVDLRHKTDATSMIEEAMILANETGRPSRACQ